MSENIYDSGDGIVLTLFGYNFGVRGIQINGRSRGDAPVYTEMREDDFDKLVKGWLKFKRGAK